MRYQEFLDRLGLPEGTRLVTVIDLMRVQLSPAVCVIIESDSLPTVAYEEASLVTFFGVEAALEAIRDGESGPR